jgi:tetratricopeptide (TPR) repeat protein
MTGSDEDARRAESLAQRSLSQQQKNNPAARLALAQALMQRHQFALGLEQTQLAAQERPKDAAIRLVEVDALLGLGEVPKARERLLELPKAAESIPGKLRLAQMGFLYDERERSAQLWLDCLAALRGQPEEAWVLVMMGHQEMLLGRLERARARFREVLQSEPTNVLALEHLAETYEMSGDIRRARVLLEDSLALDPAPEFMDRLAAILADSGDSSDSARARELRTKALAIYEDAARRDPPAHARSLADALLEREQEPERALALARENLKYRRDSGSLITLAAALRANGQFPEALAAAREALQFQSPYPHWIEELILCARAAGDKALAAKALPAQNSIIPTS